MQKKRVVTGRFLMVDFESMPVRLKTISLAIFNIIVLLTGIGLVLLLIFWHEPMMQWLRAPVVVGTYFVMIVAFASAPIRIHRWLKGRRVKRRGFPIELDNCKQLPFAHADCEKDYGVSTCDRK